MSVDLRNRVDSEQHSVQACRFFRETLPPLLDAHQDRIVPGARALPIERLYLSCTLHMARPPVKHPRKVHYTGFTQRPIDPEAAELQRRRLSGVRSKTHTSVSQPPGYVGD